MGDSTKDRPQVCCEGKPIHNVYISKYLGSLFSADGQQIYDIRSRVMMTDDNEVVWSTETPL